MIEVNNKLTKYYKEHLENKNFETFDHMPEYIKAMFRNMAMCKLKKDLRVC